ncbi:MAG: hypothetical protein CMO30_15235 [Tistrella sp.]|uniref:hypothetical protein n=1 Tax=Tistrella sp. TaxID=2024861 RepID=UPI000C692A74|nr:hypothetical protein [Tistrella sp.]MAD35815.1 hypothetical protein [Tistrella sp.]MBA76622.1 hypothetical protein [Tistrella sp.]|tara:strand:- start:607 stop:1035 length:429 start_codon:yes stop_codon:yes gene_type:complete
MTTLTIENFDGTRDRGCEVSPTPKVRRNIRPLYVALAVAAIAVATMPDAAHAGTGGEEFNEITALLTGWVTGTLGRMLTLMSLIGVAAVCAVKHHLGGLMATGGMSIALLFVPDILETFFTATISASAYVPAIFSGMSMPPM